MEAAYLTLSIDLDAEIAKITQRQYLNDVHYLVSLVRHALACRPGSIHIDSGRTQLEISQDGRCFSEEEWQLLHLILETGRDDWQPKQEALTRLEEKHGIAILSLLVNSEYTEIMSATRALYARHGALSTRDNLPARPGYLIRVLREAQPKSEMRELRFFCAGATVPIYVNGERINQPIEFEDQMLKMGFNLPEGRGAVGIPRIGDTCCLTFYKCGVRLGTRQFVSPSGLTYHGYWDSHLSHFESDYRESLTQGEAQLTKHARLLYEALPAHFGQFADEDKMRLKKLLMREGHKTWQQHYAEIPLFHSCRETFALSLQHLMRLSRQFAAVPYSPRPHKDLPAYIPRLMPEDIFFLRMEMKMAVRLVAKPRHPQTVAPQRVEAPPPENANKDPWQLKFATEAARDGMHRFYFCRGRMGVSTTREGRTLVFLDETDERVCAALENYRYQPESFGVLKYRLLALALGG